MATILVVDDEKNYRIIMGDLLSEEGWSVRTAESALQALKMLKEEEIDLVITEMKMPRMSGIELVSAVKKDYPDLPVMIMTAFGTVEKAVEAMKKGAFDYITKPFQNEEMKFTIRKALDMVDLVRENRELKRALKGKAVFEGMVGKSKSMREIFELIRKVAPTRSTVLISGESGTGKELIARAIHARSPRHQGPFISLNCGALTETLLESEMFGHEKGAFTGAIATKQGRFELAHGGTFFLDEIGDMPLSLQIKLLRVLEEMSFERVGGTRSIKVDVRLVSATNKDLREEVKAGRFREELYYRINVVLVEVPPLRRRKEDLPLLLTHFLTKISQEIEKKSISLSPEAVEKLINYPWPGNIRELENVLERAMIVCKKEVIEVGDLSEIITKGSEGVIKFEIPLEAKLNETMEWIEKEMIRRALDNNFNNVTHASQMLGIDRQVLQYKTKKHNLS
jgi:two-component system NtrC family response regulator